MKIISDQIIKNFKKKIINIHPSLLPKFKGLNTFSKYSKIMKKNLDAQFTTLTISLMTEI